MNSTLDHTRDLQILDTYSKNAESALEGMVLAVAGRVQEAQTCGIVPYEWVSPADIISDFLYDGFIWIHRVLEGLKYDDPTEAVARFGERFAAMAKRLYEEVRKCCERLALPYRGIFHRQGDLVGMITTPGLVRGREVPRYFRGNVEPTVFRRMVIDHVIDLVRYVFCVARDLFRRLDMRLRRGPKPIVPGRYAAAMFDAQADVVRGTLVLLLEGRRRLFNISSRKVWDCLRALLETDDASGAVSLPSTFRSAFVTKDVNGNRVKDDLYELDMLIVAVGSGRYRLSDSPRTPLPWNR